MTDPTTEVQRPQPESSDHDQSTATPRAPRDARSEVSGLAAVPGGGSSGADAPTDVLSPVSSSPTGDADETTGAPPEAPPGSARETRNAYDTPKRSPDPPTEVLPPGPASSTDETDERGNGVPSALRRPSSAWAWGSSDARSTAGSGRPWFAVAAVAALVGALIGAGAGLGTATALRPSTTIVEHFAANTSLPPATMDIQAVLARVLPAVVSITASGPAPAAGGFGGGFGFFGGPFGGSASTAEGTGMVVTPDGEVVTNNHVIAGATTISVTIPGSTKQYPATVIGADPTDDVALLQVHGVSGLPTVTFGNSATVEVGDAVLAIGNALGLAGGPTVTNGIVSALGRTVTASDGSTTETLTDMIQTDAAINPGNSGGPLVNAHAQVIGMNTAVAQSAGPGNAAAQDIGFAIPVDKIESLLPLLRKGGTVTQGTAYLGVEVVTLTPEVQAEYGIGTQTGALVAAVASGSPAATAGIRPGDVIVRVDSTSIGSAEDLVLAIRAHRPGDRVTISYWRGSVERSTTVVLGSTPTTEG
jgi:S1-C subfamily serine protease